MSNRTVSVAYELLTMLLRARKAQSSLLLHHSMEAHPPSVSSKVLTGTRYACFTRPRYPHRLSSNLSLLPIFSFRHKGIIADESQNFIFRLPFFKEGLQHQALRVLGLGILQKSFGSLPVQVYEPLFPIRTKDSLRSLVRERDQTGNRFPTISDQNLHPRFDVIQIFAEAGFEFRHSSRFQNPLPFI